MSSRLRELFPDGQAVKIYPDDFIKNDSNGGASSNIKSHEDHESPSTEVERNLIFPDLLDRQQGHFSDRRLLVLFRPGRYHDINFPVGYWTQVMGLGETPEQVTFSGCLGVYALPANTDNPNVGSLDTFWRGAENFCTQANFVQKEKDDSKQYHIPLIVPSSKDVTPEQRAKDIIHSLTPDATTGTFPSLYPLPDLSKSFPKDASNYDPSRGMLWAVSQAAPLRRIAVDGNLHLSLGNNNASGGFLGNILTKGYLMMGSQQQFCVRNCRTTQKVFGGAWSVVFNGCLTSGTENTGNNKTPWVGNQPLVVTEPLTGVRVEKPFLCIGRENDDEEDEKVYLVVPQFQLDSQGSDHAASQDKLEIDNHEKVLVVGPGTPFSQVQGAANRRVHLILSPGIYNWGATLEIRCDNQVVLGLGLATLQAPGTGRPCIHVSSQAKGVRLSGLSLEASVISKFVYDGSTLLEWGDNPASTSSSVSLPVGSPDNPGAIHDLYCFVGGRSPDRTVQVQTMVKIYSNHVVGDNLWLWRADHVKLMNELEKPNKPELSEYHVTTYGECRCDTGLEVFGDYVTFYGLAVEHTYRDMVIWHGKHGSVYFYQSEMPYDIPGKAYNDVTGYRVYPTAEDHIAKGIGVYSYFRDYDDVVVDSAVAHHAPTGEYKNVFAVWLNGHSGIRSILNGQGGNPTMPGRPFSIPSYQGPGMMSSHYWKGSWKKITEDWF